ncbi:hypothetical protein ACW4TU_01145 [Streptomyces sp. QTS52]
MDLRVEQQIRTGQVNGDGQSGVHLDGISQRAYGGSRTGVIKFDASYGNDGQPWPGVIDDVPDVFKPFVEEAALTDENGVPVVTARIWRETTDDRWQHGTIDFPPDRADPDGSAALFKLLVDRFLKRSSTSPRTTTRSLST